MENNELKFTKLSDVEVIEEVTEEDTVLVVQGGEVKQAPKTQVGGANAYDIVIHFNGEINVANFDLVSGDYATLRDKLISGVQVTGVVTVAYPDADNCIINGAMPIVYIETYADYEDMICIYFFRNGELYRINFTNENNLASVAYERLASSFDVVES